MREADEREIREGAWASIRMRIGLLALGVALAGCAGDPPERIPPGVWGGVGLALTVADEGAAAEFDCATGVVPEPLALDASGRFAIRGTVTLGHGGPDREGQEPDVRSAVYEGWLDDDLLLLSVRIENVNSTGEAFRLRRNDPGVLRRCL